MGLCIRAVGCNTQMDMGYFSFASLRGDIATHIGWRGGNPYCDELWPRFTSWLQRLVDNGLVSPGTVRFLTASDCSGRLSPSSCKGMEQDIRGMENNTGYGYAWSRNRGIDAFKRILRHCVANNRCLTWG